MGSKKLVGLMVVALLIASFCVPAFAESKKEYCDQLSAARSTFISERDKLHDQDRALRVSWHNERTELYKQLKANPGDRAIQGQINDGAKKFFADKKDVYQKLEQQRKDWLQTKKELGNKIKSAS